MKNQNAHTLRSVCGYRQNLLLHKILKYLSLTFILYVSPNQVEDTKRKKSKENNGETFFFAKALQKSQSENLCNLICSISAPFHLGINKILSLNPSFVFRSIEKETFLFFICLFGD